MDPAKISEKPEVKLHFLDYWRVIQMRKSLILTVFLLVVITTTVMTFWLLPEKYASFVRIQIMKDAPEVGLTESRIDRQYFDPYFLQTEFQIIKSSTILNSVITNMDLCKKLAAQRDEPVEMPLDEAYEILSKRIKVEQTRGTTLVEIWVYDFNRDQAAQIANKIQEIYTQFRRGTFTTNRQAGIEALKLQLADKIAELHQKESALDSMVKEKKIPLTEDGMFYTTTIYPERLRRLEGQRIDAKEAYMHDSSLLARIVRLSPNEQKNALPTILPLDSSLVMLTERLGAAEEKFLVNSNTLGAAHPDFKNSKDALELVQRQVDEKVAGLVRGLQERVDAEFANVQNLEEQVRAATKESGESSEEYRPYIRLKREVESLHQMTEQIEKRVLIEAVEVVQPNDAVRIIDIAKPGIYPVSPNKPLNLALGIIVGLIVGVGLAFFIEYLDTSVKTIDDVERALGAPVLAVIPQQIGELLEEGLESPHGEAYRVLRTNLLFARKDETWNTITVLSSGAGEGKSTTLFNLATVFAQAGARVLIVDSDLNRPSIHKILRLSNTIGLTDYLLNKHKLEEIIQTTPQANLDFMPSGRLPRTSMGILSSNAMKEMVKEVKRRYDYVFFDAPPLLGVSDASVLASLMDMTLQVIQYRRYPQLMTIRAKQMILNVGGHLMGIVLNNINMSQDENYYYYSGYYEYKAKQKGAAAVKDDKPGDDASKNKGEVKVKQKY